MESEPGTDRVQFNWPNVGLAILLLPVLIPASLAVLILQAFGWGKKRRSPEEVAGYLRSFIDGTGGDPDWDEFETVPILDPRLDAIRLKAAEVGPPVADLDVLRGLLARAEAIARETPHPSASG